MTDDLVTRAKTLSAMINLGERIAWGQDTAMIDELSDRIEQDAATIARLEGEIKTLTTAGIIEVAVRNPSVSDYMQHWEARAEAAEAKVAALVGTLQKIAEWPDYRLPKPCDIARAAITAAKEGA